MHILHTLQRAHLLCSSSLREGWVFCNSWKCISFFGKIAVSLMFNPRASVVVVPANSILIIQSGYSFYNWTTKASDRCGQGNLKTRWHKEIKFTFCQNQILKKDAYLVWERSILIYRKVMAYGNILIPFPSFYVPSASSLLSLLISMEPESCWFRSLVFPKVCKPPNTSNVQLGQL